MPTPFDVDSLALEMKAAQDAVRQIETFTSRLTTFDLAAAYEVAHRIHRARIAEGARPIGRKIGFTNRDMWARYRVNEPIWAHVYDTTVVQLQGTQAACSLGRFAEPMIEPEFVFHFRKGLPAGAGVADVMDAVDWVAHGFEIVQSPFPGWKFRAPDTVADGSLHARLFVGPPQPLAGLGSDPMAALASFSLSLSCDGRPVATGIGANVLGSPPAAVAHLASVLARQPHGEPLREGEIVTTGTITTAQPVRPGEVWRTEVDGIALPGLEIAFAA